MVDECIPNGSPQPQDPIHKKRNKETFKCKDELVRTGLFGVAAAAAGAAHAAQDAAPAKKRLSENWDVVVVGAGFAGMCAALEAAERGAKTVLLEKMNRPDGATVYSSGWIAAVGSRFQKNHPEDSPKAFFEDMMRLSHQRSDPELIKVYAEESGAGLPITAPLFTFGKVFLHQNFHAV